MGVGCSIPKPLIKFVQDDDAWMFHLEDSRNTYKLMVIDFSASRTGTCGNMGAFVNRLASKYRDVKFITVNADKMPDLVDEYGIKAMPTFVLMRSGKELDRVVGTDKDQLLTLIEQHNLGSFY